MQWGYGSFRCETGEARPTQWTEQIVRSARNVPQSVIRTLAVEFDIIKESQLAIHDRLQQIYTACDRDGLDVGFYLDNGNKSHFFITNSGTNSGVLVAQRPLAQPSDDADYATHLKATASFQAVYAPEQVFGGTFDTIVDYGESVEMIGDGGPRTAMLVTDTGTPQQYTLCDATPVVIRQSGFIVQTVPGVNPNAYVANSQYLDHESRSLVPSVRWNARTGKAEYALNWSFTFVLPSWQGYFNPVLR